MPRARTSSLCGVALAAAVLAAAVVRAQGTLSLAIAHYEITHDGRRELLDVVRTNDRIEHRYLTRGIVEVWSRDPRGELSHWKVFPKSRRAVHYTAGDLRTIGAEPSWEELATLLAPAERARLVARGTKHTRRGRATVLEGELRRAPVRVVWNEPLGWAEDIALGSAGTRKRYRLLEVQACSPASCASLDTQDVRELEFADLGDMERDPFVRSFQATFAAHAH